MMVKYKKKIQKSGINSWCHKRANGANEYWLKVAFLQLPNCKHVHVCVIVAGCENLYLI